MLLLNRSSHWVWGIAFLSVTAGLVVGNRIVFGFDDRKGEVLKEVGLVLEVKVGDKEKVGLIVAALEQCDAQVNFDSAAERCAISKLHAGPGNLSLADAERQVQEFKELYAEHLRKGRFW